MSQFIQNLQKKVLGGLGSVENNAELKIKYFRRKPRDLEYLLFLPVSYLFSSKEVRTVGQGSSLIFELDQRELNLSNSHLPSSFACLVL